MLVLDRSGLLEPVLTSLPERADLPTGIDAIAGYCDPFVNWAPSRSPAW